MTEFYHVTFKTRVKTILSDGIVPKRRSIYKGLFTEIKDIESIYGFTNFDDAARWASRMNFDFKRPVVIVIFKDDLKNWKEDIHFEGAGSKGMWIKKKGIIPAKNITEIINHTQEMTRAIVQTLGSRKQLYKDGKIR